MQDHKLGSISHMSNVDIISAKKHNLRHNANIRRMKWTDKT